MLETLFSIAFFLFGGNIIDTKLKHHKYEKEDYKKIFKLKNKESVKKITRWDIFNMRNWLPRWILQIPYDILNRFNRHSLQDDNENLVNTIVYTDYCIKNSNKTCLDHFVIATK